MIPQSHQYNLLRLMRLCDSKSSVPKAENKPNQLLLQIGGPSVVQASQTLASEIIHILLPLYGTNH